MRASTSGVQTNCMFFCQIIRVILFLLFSLLSQLFLWCLWREVGITENLKMPRPCRAAKGALMHAILCGTRNSQTTDMARKLLCSKPSRSRGLCPCEQEKNEEISPSSVASSLEADDNDVRTCTTGTTTVKASNVSAVRKQEVRFFSYIQAIRIPNSEFQGISFGGSRAKIKKSALCSLGCPSSIFASLVIVVIEVVVAVTQCCADCSSLFVV